VACFASLAAQYAFEPTRCGLSMDPTKRRRMGLIAAPEFEAYVKWLWN